MDNYFLIRREAKPIALKVFEKMPETKKKKKNKVVLLNTKIWVSIAIQLVLGGCIFFFILTLTNVALMFFFFFLSFTDR